MYVVYKICNKMQLKAFYKMKNSKRTPQSRVCESS